MCVSTLQYIIRHFSTKKVYHWSSQWLCKCWYEHAHACILLHRCWHSFMRHNCNFTMCPCLFMIISLSCLTQSAQLFKKVLLLGRCVRKCGSYVDCAQVCTRKSQNISTWFLGTRVGSLWSINLCLHERRTTYILKNECEPICSRMYF